MIRVYRSRQIGTGTVEDPYRSILHDFVDVFQGDSFDEIRLPTGMRSICLLDARQSVHDALVAYETANPGTVNYLSSLHADMAGLRAQYAQAWSSLPQTFRTKAENLLGVDGLTDFSGTIKQVLKRVLQRYRQVQRGRGGSGRALETSFKFGGEIF